MSDKLILLFVSVCALHLELVFGQSCSDCMPYNQCAPALNLLRKNDSPSRATLRSVFCGFRNGSPKVCCSSLADVDSHPNLSLLPTQCGFIDEDRIIGGTETGLYEFPWMVLISHKISNELKFRCGGTLINERYVLTASHCIKNLDIAGVRVGEHDLRTDEDCQNEPPKVICERRLQDIRVEKAIVHPDYKSYPELKNDIGLLRLEWPVEFNFRNAKPICLPITAELRNRDIQGINGTVTGWGVTDDRTSSPVLLKVYVPIHSADNCRRKYNKGKKSGEDSTINKFCAGEFGKDSCKGDSGGPLMLPGLHNNVERYIQYGIVSYGKQCGSDDAGVYTDVSKFMKWILDNIRP